MLIVQRAHSGPPGVSDLGVAIEAWMASMYHRRPMLDRRLERIGVGYARLTDGMPAIHGHG
jgi:uncharacterized protein YkwD